MALGGAADAAAAVGEIEEAGGAFAAAVLDDKAVKVTESLTVLIPHNRFFISVINRSCLLILVLQRNMCTFSQVELLHQLFPTSRPDIPRRPTP